MIDRCRSLVLPALLLLLAGCATAPTQPSAVPAAPAASAPVPQVVPQGAIPQPPVEGVVIQPVPKSDMSSNKAIIALLDRAQRDNEAGQREAADVSLERALRIEPRNAWLWHELAKLRLTQGQYAQAMTLARKSISFAGHDNRLKALNWQVIGNARVGQGDSAGAEEAFKRSADFAHAAQADIVPLF